jgi:hypothetical protein
LKINLISPWYSWKIAELALNNNHSLTQAFLTGEGEIVHLSGKCIKSDGYDCSISLVKVENFWNVVEDSVAKKNTDKDMVWKYVFHNNIIILYLR